MRAHPLSERSDPFHAFHMAIEIPESPTLPREHAKRPTGLTRHIDQIPDFERWRDRKAVFQVAVPLTQHLQINGHH